MIYKFEPILAEISMQVLQELAFIFAEPVDPDRPEDCEPFVAGALVEFSGPMNGSVTVAVTQNMLEEITANMLGVEKTDITAEYQNDALKEIVNVICGNLLPRMAGNDVVLDISPPRLTKTDPGGISGENQKHSVIVTLSADEGFCGVRMSLKQ